MGVVGDSPELQSIRGCAATLVDSSSALAADLETLRQAFPSPHKDLAVSLRWEDDGTVQSVSVFTGARRGRWQDLLLLELAVEFVKAPQVHRLGASLLARDIDGPPEPRIEAELGGIVLQTILGRPLALIADRRTITNMSDAAIEDAITGLLESLKASYQESREAP